MTAAALLLVCVGTACSGTTEEKPERTVLFVIDGMVSGLHERVDMPAFSALAGEGVLYKEVYLPLPAHPDSSAVYPWSCSIPNPVLMSGTIFIGQAGVRQNLIQQSFTGRPTAFVVNSPSYTAIRDGFTIYRQLPKGRFDPVFPDSASVNVAKEIITANNPEFIRIHCQGLGGAGSICRQPDKPYTNDIWHAESPYRIQARHIDSLLGAFVQWLKDENLWDGTVLMVMGDHGQADGGWHPPYEPGGNVTQLLVAGKGIRQGMTIPYAEIIDVAPTIAWLQRVETSKFSNGRVLKELIGGEVPVVPHRMQELDSLLTACRRLGADTLDDEAPRIELIGRWHEGSQGSNYPAFVEAQARYLDRFGQRSGE
jgi:hypothetical protein